MSGVAKMRILHYMVYFHAATQMAFLFTCTWAHLCVTVCVHVHQVLSDGA